MTGLFTNLMQFMLSLRIVVGVLVFICNSLCNLCNYVRSQAASETTQYFASVVDRAIMSYRLHLRIDV